MSIRDFGPKAPMRSEAYLDWVRSQPCAGCGVVARVDAHHVISDRHGSSKASDLHSIPLCRGCHQLLHQGWRDWEAMYGPQWRHCAKTLEQAARLGVLVIDAKAAKELA